MTTLTLCEKCATPLAEDQDWKGRPILLCPQRHTVELSCREHPWRPFKAEVPTCFAEDIECTECGYQRTYHPGDEEKEGPWD